MNMPSIETEVLRLCMRAQINRGTGVTAVPTDFGFAGVQWDHLLWLGHSHRVLSLLDTGLRAFPPGQIPPGFLAQVESARHANEIRRLARGREVCLIQDAFQRQRIPALVVSGWAVAESHYSRPEVRDIGESLTFLVAPSRRGATENVLAELGYDLSPDPLRLRNKDRSQVRLISAVGAGDASEGYIECDVWMRSETLNLGGRSITTLGPADWLIILSALGLKHHWMQLCRSMDIVSVCKRHPTLNWNDLFERAQRIGLEPAVIFGVAVSHLLIGLPLPNAIETRLADFRFVRRQSVAVFNHIASGTMRPWSQSRLVQMEICLQQGGWRKLRRLGHHLRMACSRRIRATLPHPADANVGRYAPTPQPVAMAMLKLARTTASDVVYDLGSGDGRIVIAAATEYGARGVGIDIDPERINEARKAAAETRVGERIDFVCADALQADVSPATVICLYLQGFAYEKIRRKLRRELRPGTRVVSHDFTFSGWAPERTEIVKVSPRRVSRIYLWRI